MENNLTRKNEMDVKENISTILPVIAKVSIGDFSERIKLRDDKGEFTELIVGLNMMADDLQYTLKKEKEAEEALEKINQELDKRVKERTAELEKRLEELELFRSTTVDRELRMIELEKEVNALLQELGRQPRYD